MLEGYNEYKEINLPWLHSIPSHWNILRNKNVMLEQKEIVGSNSHKHTLLSLTLKGIIERDLENAKGKFPKEFDSYKIVKTGNIVFCLFDIDETPRTVGLAMQNGMLTGAYDVFEPNNSKINGYYLYYYYLSLDNIKALKPLYTGLRKVINISSFNSLKLPIPPRPEQDQIVRYLDWKVSMFNKYINAKKNQIELLKERKQTIINQAVTKGLNMNVPIKDSGIEWLGKIPAHWNILYLSQVAEEQYISNKEVHNQNLLSLSYGNIVNKDINTTEGLLPASFDTYQIVNPGNVILRLTDLQNDWKSLRVGLATQTGIITSAYVCLFCKDIILPEYLYLLLHSFDIRKVFYGMGGGVRQSIGYKEIRKLLLLIPPQAEQQRIANYCKDIILEIGNNINYIEKTINLLQEYRICLISDVVTGKVNVQNIKVPDFVNAEWQAYCYSEEDV